MYIYIKCIQQLYTFQLLYVPNILGLEHAITEMTN